MLDVTVVGQGYVGLVTAAGAAEWGHQVVGVEKDPGRRDSLLDGQVPFHEPIRVEEGRFVRPQMPGAGTTPTARALAEFARPLA